MKPTMIVVRAVHKRTQEVGAVRMVTMMMVQLLLKKLMTGMGLIRVLME